MTRKLCLPILIFALLIVGPGAAAQTKIKLATLAPDGSPWHRQLQSMGQAWQQRTDGRVRLVIYPGGVAGDDPDMVRKLRIGQIQAAALTVTGLADIDPAFNVFSIPLFFDSFEEFVYVRARLTPELSRRLEAKGFVLLHWGHGGWVHFFSKQPVRTVDELRRVKIFTWAGDNTMSEIYKANGFQPVPLAATDILTGLQTGLIDALPSTPLAALSLQWFRQTPYMLDAPIAPLIGATVMSQRAWNKLSETDRRQLLEAARESEPLLDAEIPKKDSQAVEEMQRRGLTVLEPAGGEEAAAWSRVAAAFAEAMRNAPTEVREAAQRYRDEFRRSRADDSTP